jgi:hypothetical protein
LKEQGVIFMESQEYSFTLFEPHKNRSAKATEPLVEIRPNGRILFNKIATELLATNQFCKLGYDAEKNTVGLLPLHEHSNNTFPIRYAAKGAYIGAKPFFKHFGILPDHMVEGAPFTHNEFIGLKM